MGETLVIDTHLDHCGPVMVEGTLVVDGAELNVYDDAMMMIVPSIIRVSGVLRLVNGSALLGYFDIEIQEGGLVEFSDSRLDARSSGACHLISARGSELIARGSTLTSTTGLFDGRGSNLTLVNSTVTTGSDPVALEGLLVEMSGSVQMEGTTVIAEGPALRVVDTARVDIEGCHLSASNGATVHVEGANDIALRGTSIENGTKGLVLDYSRRAVVENVTVRGSEGWGCDLTWLGSLSMKQMDVRDCHGVGVNVSNCTQVTVEDLTVRRIGAKGIGFTAQYTEPLEGVRITTRGVKQGVYLVYTNHTNLESVDVDGSTLYGVHLSKSSDITIEGLKARRAGVDGLYSGWSRRVQVTNATLDDAGECGAFLSHSSVTLTRTSASNCGMYGVRAAMHSTFLVGCNLSNNGLDGLFSLDQGGAGISNCNVLDNRGNGTRFLNVQSPFLKNSTISYNAGAGVLAHYLTKGASVEGCRIQGNAYGILLNGATNLSCGSTLRARQSLIFDNDVAGAFNWEKELTLDASYCWWGNNTGPSNASRNPGGSGDEVWGGVRFKPWLKLGNLPPVVEGPTDIQVLEGTVGDFPYNAFDYDDEDEDLRFHLEGAPRNVSIDEMDGWLRVKPEDAEVGNWTFRVVVMDPQHGIGRLKVRLEVVGVNDPPTILVPSDGYTVDDDQEFAFRLRAVDQDSDPEGFEWRILEGPGWIEVSSNGTVTGVTTDKRRGEHTFKVQVDDGDGGTDIAVLTLVVVPTYDFVSIDPMEGLTAYEDLLFRATFTATCDVEAELTWDLSTAAAWLHLEASNQTVWGKPAQGDVGTFSVRVTVSDQWGCEDTRLFPLSVLPVNDPPEWRDPPDLLVVNTTDTTFSLAPFVYDPDDPVEELTLACEDRHVRFLGSLMVLKFKRGAQPVDLTLMLSDPHGANATHVISVLVNIPPEEVEPPSTAIWFPWLLLAVITALAIGTLLVARRRRLSGYDLPGDPGTGLKPEGESGGEGTGSWIPDTLSRPPPP